MTKLYLGLMSGTSLDGVDLALVQMDEQHRPQLQNFRFIPYLDELRDELLRMMNQTPSLPEQLAAHQRLGRIFAEAIADFLAREDIDRTQIQALGMHGVTLFHQPEPHQALNGWGCGTLQLGDPHVVRAFTGIRVVNDFRHADMALGGQGAPLAPFLDRLLFRSEQGHRILLNLGGIANMTILRDDDDKVLAFDSGPANMIMDALMRVHPETPGAYDPDGSHAARGKVIPELLDQLLEEPYLQRPAPKSTGRELFNDAFMQRFLDWQPREGYDDLLATAASYSARTVADGVKRYLPDYGPEDRLIAAGGGVHNPTLMARIAEQLPGLRIQTTADYGLPEDAKEATLMAVLAHAYDHEIPANIPEVTGAQRLAVLGASTR